jgi:glycosyltransferase involved in cell wall biosynthesis
MGSVVAMKIVIALNTAWNLINFRAGLIRALQAEGYDVVAVAPSDEYVSRLVELGCRYEPLPMDNKGTNPGQDALLLWRFYWLLRRERPLVYLGYTIKPNVYGSLAAHLLGIPVINNIAGLGAVFTKENWLTLLVRGLYRISMSRSKKVFFQNEEDRKEFIEGGLLPREITDRVPGSGIDLVHFAPGRRVVDRVKPFRFLLTARMLWDKGIGEYVEAAHIIHSHGREAEFCLLGFLDVLSPGAITRDHIEKWVAEGTVRYLGVSHDVRTEIALADCVVLPSYYREGVPRTLLEAAAMGCPIITTDAVGCREVVDNGQNGFLCRVCDPADLAEKMERMLSLSDDQRHAMGLYGRQKMEREFDEKIVIKKYLDAIHTVKQVMAPQSGELYHELSKVSKRA